LKYRDFQQWGLAISNCLEELKQAYGTMPVGYRKQRKLECCPDSPLQGVSPCNN
jgi:hypothetical protein